MSAETSFSITKLNKVQITNILKIKALREDVKKGVNRPSKEYTEIAKNQYKSKVPENKEDPGYQAALTALTNEMLHYAKISVPDINPTETKFAQEYEKAHPKATFKGQPEWATDGESARVAIKDLCESGLLEDKKYKAVFDRLNNVYLTVVPEMKEARKAKIAKTREAKNTPEGKKKLIKMNEEKIEKTQKALKKLIMEEKEKPSKSTSSKIETTTVAEESEYEEESDEVEGSEVEGDASD